MTIETKIAKFEEGKTYYRIWNEDTGRPHMSHFTITKRTAKTVVLKNGYRCRIFINDNGVEVFKAGYDTYVYADNLCTVEAEKRQANSDAAWNKMEADAQRRMLELKAAEAERYEIMSTPLTTEGSINDLDQNHIAHAPNDESLKERRTELVNELDNLNAQLAELLPTEPNTNSEYKYYIQSRRPIAGAVPNGYISATAGEMKVHSLRSDGSISPVPRKVVFGVAVYDHPLSDEQIINYDLHVDPLNPKAEPDTTELSDQEIAEIKRRSQINAIKSRIATYERAIERQYDQELENSLIEAKAQLAEIEPNTTPQVDPIITDRNHNLIADHITGIKEEQPMTDKLIISTKENADGRITAYYLNGKKTRKAEIEYCYANNPAYDGIIQTDYYTAKYQFPNLYYGHGCRYFIMTLNEETLMSKAAADLLGYQIGRPFARGIYRVIKLDQTIPDDDSSNDEEPDLIVETKRTKRDSINLKLNGSRISLRNLEERLSNAANENFSVINQYGKKYSCYPANNYGYFGESPEGYTIHFNTLGELIEHYAVDNIIHTAEPADQPTNDTPADNRHDTEEPADNPTNDTQDTDQPIDPPAETSNHKQKKNLRDSLNRAIKQCIRNRIGYLKSQNSKMEKYEYELLCLLQGARRELEIA